MSPSFLLVPYLKHHHFFLHYWSSFLQGSLSFQFRCLKNSLNYIKLSLWKFKCDNVIYTYKVLWWFQWFYRIKYKLLGKVFHMQAHTFYSTVDLKPFPQLVIVSLSPYSADGSHCPFDPDHLPHHFIFSSFALCQTYMLTKVQHL